MTPEALAAALAAGERPVLLDARTADAFSRAHLPGSLHLPADELEHRYGELDRLAGPWVVVPPREGDPEAPAHLLREAGFSGVSTLEGGLSRWTGPVERGGPGREHAPLGDEETAEAAWVVRQALGLIRPWGRVLDVACGRGRDAVFLAREGLEVVAVDRDREALTALEDAAAEAAVRVQRIQADLETDPPGWLPQAESFDAVIVVHYLWRPLLPRLAAAVRPGGVLAYETFTVDQRRYGRPHDAAFLLEQGELLEALPGWTPLVWREGPVGGKEARCALVARRPMRAA